MRFKDILTVITSATHDQAALALGQQLAEQNSGRLSVEVIGWLPSVVPVEPFVINPLYGDLVQTAKADLEREIASVKARLSRETPASSVGFSLLEFGAAQPVIGMRARHADVAVVSRPTKETWDSRQAILEAALFDSGRPVLVAPQDWKRRPIGKSVLIAWKPTREAARALADAEDFIACADRVIVVTVDAKPSEEGYGVHPGVDIAAHLARREAKVELLNLASAGRDEARAILDQALAVDADLIVMGGYGRSRMSEFIFGGMTREMVRGSIVPLLISH